MSDVRIACDGACRGNPGPGAFAAVIEEGGAVREVAGAERDTTNNRMELLGAISGLEALAQPSQVTVECDSTYVVKGMREWVAGWQRRGWRTADKRPVLNRDLWERLVRAAAPHKVRWVWVQGHAGHPGNERCDRIANETIDRMLAGDASVLLAPSPAAAAAKPAVSPPSSAKRPALARKLYVRCAEGCWFATPRCPYDGWSSPDSTKIHEHVRTIEARGETPSIESVRSALEGRVAASVLASLIQLESFAGTPLPDAWRL